MEASSATLVANRWAANGAIFRHSSWPQIAAAGGGAKSYLLRRSADRLSCRVGQLARLCKLIAGIGRSC